MDALLGTEAALTLFAFESWLLGLFVRVAGLLFRLDFADFAAFATCFAFALLAAFGAFGALAALAVLRAGRALVEGLRFAAPLLGRLAAFAAFTAFTGRALLLLALRVGIGAAAFKRFSSTGVDSSSPATRARAAPSDRAGADVRGDGNAAPAADLLAFVFMAINVWGWQPARS